MNNLLVCLLFGVATAVCPHARTSKVTVEEIVGPFDLGEGPHWDEENQLLYFVDIHQKKFHALDPTTKRVTETFLKNGPVGVAVPVAGKKHTFLAGSGTDLVEFIWDPSTNNPNPQIKVLSTVDQDRVNNRFNDGKVDPAGRFWAGTMSEKDGEVTNNQGALYRFDDDGTPVKMISNISISNGLCWSHDNETFYYIDSPTREVVAYDYDVNTGDISNKRVIFNFEANNVPAIPDGMTIDKNGNLWVAVWDGARILEIDPEMKSLVRTITMPASRITSMAFGGPDYDILYVTSAKHRLTEAELKKQPTAGFVFAIHGLETAGVKPLDAKMN